MDNAKESAESSSSTAGKPIFCKAAVLWEVGGKYRMQNIVVAPPNKDQVRVKILYTSICHTDLTAWKMKEFAPALPIILGHEGAGIVESVGEGVEGLEAGDHVLPYLKGRCNDCWLCKSDKTSTCDKFPLTMVSPTIPGSTEPCYTTEDGKAINVFLATSTFSQYIVLHKASVAKINPAAPLDKVGILTCGLATGFGSAWNVAKVEKGSTVAVFGLGTIGLAVVEACKLAGASKIIGVDINPHKAELVKKFGVTDFINSNDHPEAISQVITEMTGGGVHYSFECIGLAKVMAEAVESTHSVIGTTIIVGYAGSGEPFGINPQTFIWGRSVVSSNVGRVKVTDLPGLVERALKKEFDLDAYISHQMPFSKINEAMEIFESGESLRINLNTAE